MPPRRLWTFSNPFFISILAAMPERDPDLQAMMMGRSSVLLELLQLLAQSVQGDVDGVDDMPLVEFRNGTHVHHHGILVIDERRALQWRDGVLVDRIEENVPDQGAGESHEGENQQQVVRYEFGELFHPGGSVCGTRA